MEIEVDGVRVKVVGRNSFKKVEALMRELAKKYGLNELPASQKLRRLQTKKEARQLKARVADVENVGPLAAKRSDPQRRATAKRTNTTISVRKKGKKNS
jgi:hypothetical protein